MILLKETVDFYDFNIITESEGKQLFIEGVFAQSEVKNRNGRIYTKPVMESAVNSYNEDFVLKSRALGELSHPVNRPTVDPKLATHRIVNPLTADGNNVMGKALILETPEGNVVRGLIKGGVKLGVSTRGLGSLTERAGNKYVGNDYKIMAVDIVTDPSGIDCFVDAVNESQEWLVTDDGKIIESVRETIKKNVLTEEKKIKLFMDFLESIRSK